MKIISQIQTIKELVAEYRLQGKNIGFVPTMGYLHEGHLTLMRQAKTKQGVAIASIFVNPLQFGPTEDYSVYPRDLERDAKLAESAGIDILFAPTVEEMYPEGYESMLTYVEVQKITGKLCGASRPSHFRGVTTVVAKLLNIVQPDVAYFGQKDAQQVAVIRRMVRDLNMNVGIEAVPIVRESDGLALSSRNIYLSAEERQAALVLNKALQQAERLLQAGQRDGKQIVESMKEMISAEPLAVIDYIAVSDIETLQDIAKVDKAALVAVAVKIGKTRLIDNFTWEV